VIAGKDHRVEFPSKATTIAVPFESKWGPLVVEVGLVEQPSGTPTPATAKAVGT
jgi:hypothetical protein